jgi:hypothetical protein
VDYTLLLEDALRSCQANLAPVTAIVKKLEEKLRSQKRLAAVQVVLKKEELDRMLERLHRSKVDLYFAYDLYIAVQKEASDDVRYKNLYRVIEGLKIVQTQHQELEGNGSHELKAQEFAVCKKKRRADGPLVKYAEYHIRLPLWLCRRAWDVSFQRQTGCWTTTLYTFRTISQDIQSEVEQTIYYGDLQTLKRLLSERKLGINDQFCWGRSLFGVSYTMHRSAHAYMPLRLRYNIARPTSRNI